MKSKKLHMTILFMVLILLGASFLIANGLTSQEAAGMIPDIGGVVPSTAPPAVKPATTTLPVPTTHVPVPIPPEAKNTTQSLTVFGKPVDLSGAPIVLTTEGKTILPLRKLGEALGYSVKWDNVMKAAVLEKATESILLKMDNTDYKWGAVVRALSSKPYVINNRLYVPIDFLTENPDFSVNQTASSLTVDSAAAAAKQVLTGEITEISVYANGLGLKVADNKKASIQLYVTDKTMITDYSTGEAIAQSQLKTGTKAIFSYTEVQEDAGSLYNILSAIEVVELSPPATSENSSSKLAR